MKKFILCGLLALPLAAQTADGDNAAYGAMQKRVRSLRLVNLPGIDGNMAPLPATIQPLRRVTRVTHVPPCAVRMPDAIPQGSEGLAMPTVTPPESAFESAEVRVPRVCGL